VLYHTAFAAAGRELEMRPDFYGRDESLWQRLQKRAREQGAPSRGQVAAGVTRSAPVGEPARRPVPPSSPSSAVQRRV